MHINISVQGCKLAAAHVLSADVSGAAAHKKYRRDSNDESNVHDHTLAL